MRLLAIVSGFILLTGCPTESVVPLSDSPEQKIDSSMIGSWIRLRDKPGADTTELITIIPKGDSMYKIRRKGTRQIGDRIVKETTWFDAHITIVKNYNFLNLKRKTVDGQVLPDSLQNFNIVQFDLRHGPKGDTLISRIYDGSASASSVDLRKNVGTFVKAETGLSKYDTEYSGVYYKRHRK